MWDPNENIPGTPLTKPERQDTRRIIRWFERRAFFRASLKLWAGWLIFLPSAIVAVLEIVKLLQHGK